MSPRLFLGSIGAFASLSMMSLLLPCQAFAAGAAEVSVAGPVQAVTTGQQFTLNINVNPNNAIAGMQFSLSFNPSLVIANSITEGSLLGQGGASTYFMSGQIDNTNGTVSGVAGVITGPGQTVSSSGTFASIDMTAKNANGTSPLILSNVIVGNINGQAITTTVVNGQVIVGTGGSAPILAAIGNKSVTAGQSLQFSISATDANGDSLTYSASNLPSGADFAASSRIFSWTPTSGQAGSYSSVRFQVSDGALADFEDITITVSAATPPPVAGGGGGGGGGGAPPADVTAPVVSNVVVTDITKTGAIVQWTTNEDSTSQVKYGAMPETLTPANEAMATSHSVELTGLSPCSTYRLLVVSRDRANNTRESEEYTFATLGQPATFTLSGLKVSLARVRVNEATVVKVTATNVGDLPGSYDVNLNVTSSRGSEIMRETVNLAAGASQEVSFVVTKQTSGTFQASVGDLADSFIVDEETAVASQSGPGPEIGVFSAIPTYSDANQISSVALTYELLNNAAQAQKATLVLKVGLDGEPLESVVLFSGVLPAGHAESSQWQYAPAQGWVSGSYSFEAEMYSGDALLSISKGETLKVELERPAVVSWYVLALIIGALSLAAAVTTVVLLKRRRELVKAWMEDGYTSSK